MHIVNVMPLFPKTTIVGKLTDVDTDFIINNLKETFKDDKYFSKYDLFYSTDPYLHKEEKYLPLTKQILNFVNLVCKDIFRYSNLTPRITLMWATGTTTGSTIHRHHHPNSFFSGVYYPQDIEYSALRFSNPQKPVLFPRFDEHNLYNSTSMSYCPQQGDIVLFPSDLEHDVLPNTSPQMRLSIAFNIFFSGEFGDEKSLSFLEL